MELASGDAAHFRPSVCTYLIRSQSAAHLKIAHALSGQTEEADGSDVCCVACGSGDRPEVLLLCDSCNAGFRTFCLDPPLLAVPSGGRRCPRCMPGQAEASAALDGEVDDDRGALRDEDPAGAAVARAVLTSRARPRRPDLVAAALQAVPNPLVAPPATSSALPAALPSVPNPLVAPPADSFASDRLPPALLSRGGAAVAASSPTRRGKATVIAGASSQARWSMRRKWTSSPRSRRMCRFELSGGS